MPSDRINGGKASARRVSIAIVAPPWFELPPRAYGGIEWTCYLLAEGLAARGHDVTLIGAGACWATRHPASTCPSTTRR